jgi:hypothetical protein
MMIPSTAIDLLSATYASADAVRFVQHLPSSALKTSLRVSGYGYLVEENGLEAEKDAALGRLFQVATGLLGPMALIR